MFRLITASFFFKSAVPLGMFVGSTLVAITFMGGVYAILPAYEADLFGECLQLRFLSIGACFFPRVHR